MRQYRFQFVLMVRSVSQDTTFGQQQESWTDSSTYWASKENISTREQFIHGLMGSFVDGKLYFRNNLSIKFVDRLRDASTNEVFEVKGVNYDVIQDETIVVVQKWRDS